MGVVGCCLHEVPYRLKEGFGQGRPGGHPALFNGCDKTVKITADGVCNGSTLTVAVKECQSKPGFPAQSGEQPGDVSLHKGVRF